MTGRIPWTVDHRGLSRFPLRVAVTLAGMPWSVLLAFFVVGPLAVAGIVRGLGDLRIGAAAWFVAVLFVWFTSAGAAHTEYVLDPDAERLEIRRLAAEADHPMVAPIGDSAAIDLERVESVAAFSLPGTTVITVSYDHVTLTEPTAFEVHDGDRARVQAALEAAGLKLPTAADGRIVDRRTQYVRGAGIVAALGLTVVAPALALGALAIRGALPPSFVGGIGLAFAGLLGAIAVYRLFSFPSYDEADGLTEGLVVRAKRQCYLVVGIVVGMVAYLTVVLGLASVVP